VKSTCKDVDECKANADLCGVHGTCHNLPNTYECLCDDGYAWSGTCVDVDECGSSANTCDQFPYACVNDDGAFHCECPTGYGGTGVGDDGCTDKDECALGEDTCGADTVCFNVVSSFGCVHGASAVAAGSQHTCALLEDGKVKCWGFNYEGESGTGDQVSRGSTPSTMGDSLPAVNLGTGRTAKAIAAGYKHTCALLDNGAVKCWGYNYYGQLGQGDTATRGIAAAEMGDNLAPIALGTGRTAKAIGVGQGFTCALLDNGSIKCWGENDSGALGQGDTTIRGDGPGELGDALDAIDLGTGRSAKAIATGDVHVCALLDNNSVKCWGYGGYGALGQGDANSRGDQAGEMGDALPAVNLGTGRTAKAIAAGSVSTCAVLDDNSLKCWGYNGEGELGLGDATTRGASSGSMGDALPHVDLGTGRTAKAVATGGHTCAILDDDSLKCWGTNGSGELGLGDTNNRGLYPTDMASLPTLDLGTGRTPKQISVGANHTCALLDDATLKCWGHNGFGQLGSGTTAYIGMSYPGELDDDLHPVDLGQH
jgi:alpha-tubulin suppressor-like RCC1 family protein